MTPDALRDSMIASRMREIISMLGEDPDREGLGMTPHRVARAWAEILRGYEEDPEDLVTTFESNGYDQLVLMTNIPFYSLCEHHMMPFFGRAAIGYIPNGRILGLSKLARILEIYARRLQVQERLTKQVADALNGVPLAPMGVIVVLEAEHFCMSMRGVKRPGSKTITSDLRGVLMDDPKARAEAMSLIKQ